MGWALSCCGAPWEAPDGGIGAGTGCSPPARCPAATLPGTQANAFAAANRSASTAAASAAQEKSATRAASWLAGVAGTVAGLTGAWWRAQGNPRPQCNPCSAPGCDASAPSRRAYTAQQTGPGPNMQQQAVKHVQPGGVPAAMCTTNTQQTLQATHDGFNDSLKLAIHVWLAATVVWLRVEP